MQRCKRLVLLVQKIMVDDQDAVKDVWEVLDKIKDFTDKVRDGEWLGVTGKPLTNVVAIGIGGSFLGPLFVHTALRFVRLHGILSACTFVIPSVNCILLCSVSAFL